MFYCLKNESNRTVHTKYYHPPVALKNYNDMSDGQRLFDQTLKNYLRTYDSIRKIQGDDYTTGCLLNYNYFSKYYKMITIDLSK